MKSEVSRDVAAGFQHPLPPGHRRIAWNGISFGVPSNWELAVYRFLRRGASRIELEDEYGVRLEAEWIRGRNRLRLDRIMKRYEAAAKPLTLRAEERHAVNELPDGWHATHFVFRETERGKGRTPVRVVRHDLVTAFYLDPQSSVFCFFLVHFLPEDREDPIKTLRQIAHTWQDHGAQAVVPWQLFDIAFTMPRCFTLERTHFDIGAKLMVFRWKRRRLFLWHFSCADIFLKDGVTPEQWAAGHLNGFSRIPGPLFYPGQNGAITWRRRRPFFFGHREEIARWCFRYRAGCRLDKEANRLVVWVYHYRREEDLAHWGEGGLPGSFPGPGEG